ncbi:hypothetical protein KSF78_0004274 [Schistosoma japonicum]|nr:hypothetical protein KSF78_0004274 [Schistosoma japonicum]
MAAQVALRRYQTSQASQNVNQNQQNLYDYRIEDSLYKSNISTLHNDDEDQTLPTLNTVKSSIPTSTYFVPGNYSKLNDVNFTNFNYENPIESFNRMNRTSSIENSSLKKIYTNDILKKMPIYSSQLNHFNIQQTERTNLFRSTINPLHSMKQMKPDKWDKHAELDGFHDLSITGMSSTNNTSDNTCCATNVTTTDTTINNKQLASTISNCILFDYRQTSLHSTADLYSSFINDASGNRSIYKPFNVSTSNLYAEMVHPFIKFSVSNILNRH